MKTAPIKHLVNEALAALPKPHTEDAIDDVFHAIETNPVWLKEYKSLCTDLGKDVVNQYGRALDCTCSGEVWWAAGRWRQDKPDFVIFQAGSTGEGGQCETQGTRGAGIDVFLLFSAQG